MLTNASEVIVDIPYDINGELINLQVMPHHLLLTHSSSLSSIILANTDTVNGTVLIVDT